MMQQFKELAQGKPVPFRRSSLWPRIRAEVLATDEVCAACGCKKNLNVHHIKPFHLYPELELKRTNLIVLCESDGCNCHFALGHLLNWKSYNLSVVDDAEVFRTMILNRPIPQKGQPLMVALMDITDHLLGRLT
jgi:5-methylcytosine-specific restriction protein A